MKLIITIALALISHSLSAEVVTLTAEDGFTLEADYYAGESGQPAVLLLHQCNGDRSMYQAVGRELSQHGVHVLALDFRGYGGSVSKGVDIEEIRRQTSSREEYRKAAAPIREHWASDVNIAADFLRERIGEGGLIGAGGASCGGGQSVVLAGQRNISALMMFSSGISEEMSKQTTAFNEIPTLFIVAEEDDFSYRRSRDLFANAGHTQSRMITYKGGAHGSPLYKQDPTLVDTIVNWYRLQLNAVN